MRKSQVLDAAFALLALSGGSDGETSTNTEAQASVATAATDPPASALLDEIGR